MMLRRHLPRHVAAIVALAHRLKFHLLGHDHLAVGLFLYALRTSIVMACALIDLELSETDLIRIDVFSVLNDMGSLVHGVHVALQLLGYIQILPSCLEFVVFLRLAVSLEAYVSVGSVRLFYLLIR